MLWCDFEDSGLAAALTDQVGTVSSKGKNKSCSTANVNEIKTANKDKLSLN